ncbi:MAG: putative ABC transporter permease [Patescibacteria group bacterium]|jgi:uncharacterized membrane protein
MNAFSIIATFCFYSVFGWVLDTIWRSIRGWRYVRGGFSKYPFSPIYGFGALFALGLVPLLDTRPLWFQWAFLALFLGAFEYVSGVLIVKTLHKRLWNYTEEPLDVKGHTTPFYAFAWGGLALLVIYVLQPMLEASCSTSVLCAKLLQ